MGSRGLSAHCEKKEREKRGGQWGLAPWRNLTCRQYEETKRQGRRGRRAREMGEVHTFSSPFWCVSHIKMEPKLRIPLKEVKEWEEVCASCQWLGHACPFLLQKREKLFDFLRQLEWVSLGVDCWERVTRRTDDASLGQRDAFLVGMQLRLLPVCSSCSSWFLKKEPCSGKCDVH